ncbi:hypothetical protein BC829DRAFT_405325 [Chytridium lagenaria]|nr:hypothetical protein BC829DRAFT_405325 [Chytridium lagenaria]
MIMPTFEELHASSTAASIASSDIKQRAMPAKNAFTMSHLLSNLSKDIHAIKKQRQPSATITIEAYIEKLNKEKEMLNQHIDNIWSDFDVLIRPLWRIDDSISTNSEESIDPAQGSFSAEEREADLHLSRNAFTSLKMNIGWKAGDRVPGGQALVANLLARCYKLVRQLQESEPSVAPRLYPLENRLLNIVSTLTAFKQALLSGAHIDPIELRLLQDHVRDIDSKRVDGKFIDETDGSTQIPEGQAILTGLLEEAYDLIHDCLLEMEGQSGSETDEIDALLDRVSEVRQIVSGFISRSQITPDKRDEPQDEDTTKKTSLSLLGSSSAALSALRDTLGEGYTYVRNTAGKLESGIATTVTKNTSRLVSAVRSGLSSMTGLLGTLDPVDPTLASTHARLLRLRDALLALRKDRDEEDAKRYAVAAGTGVVIRTHVAQLDEIDSLRDEETGDFVNEQGVAPQGQQVLKSLYEECYLIAYDLIR